jgi:hypothetical protein
MSFQITTAFQDQFNSAFKVLMQQEESRLEGAVRVESINGKREFFDQIDATAATKRTTRHADTPLISTPHLRRMVQASDYDWADLIDNFDKLKTVADPQGAYLKNAVMAMKRAKDDAIIAAFIATAYGGVDGTTTYTFDTANKQILASSTGLTLAKVLSAKQKLDTDEVPEEGRYFVCGSKQINNDLLNTTEIKSADYNTVKALARGEIDSFLGFKFIRSERLALASSTRYCYAWQRESVLLAINSDIITDIAPRKDKNMAVQVYAGMSIGATRMDEKGIVQIQAVEV